jgi:opacity protein-like surface antigen
MKTAAKYLLGGVVLAMAGGAPAMAADIYEPDIVEVPEYVPAVVSGWYLRGDIGMSNQTLEGGLYNVLFDTTDIVEFLDPGGFSSAPIFQVGVGYQFNNWMRADLIAQYRGAADFSALDRYETVDDANPATFDGTNDYTGKKSEWLVMANAYVDMGTIRGVTPYIGAGLGASRNTITNFRDVNVPAAGVAYGATQSVWNLAWALHAGLGFEVNDRLTLDLSYSYLHLGDAQSGDLIPYVGPNTIYNPMVFNDIRSHDIKLGLRYKFGGSAKPAEVAYQPQPLPVYK